MRKHHLQVSLQKFYASIAFAAVGYPFRRVQAEKGQRPGHPGAHRGRICRHALRHIREIRKQKIKGHGTGISYCEVEALTRILFPQIQVFFESEEGLTAQGGNILIDAPALDAVIFSNIIP